ncbi:Exopolysaccharide biosynthesis protein [Clostridium cochlearium]|jgi:exopolysaccharide biosynthesis protein|uniref:Exopolysaccharide biosynthesis protein n=1 Tax=Clostridium cochlearium TaxID=1494 RepID=A0A239ZI59_CLOCO|nr:phosphodiester glycosidase family protein [Clostridium cochlearium]MBV1821089.1 phosphodiester glycosidase family protein [Bacteroidales bacterium MSK.15.36]SDK85003.1 Exopolysaccharide biosynthesis protein [Clostridium cochlearium]SNV70942.1 exported protein [Clostridium cochlearium]SQB36097.1 exported protein [Clostridium cochlearium]STA91969.1 exported protein [Clostridium cochlearium]
MVKNRKVRKKKKRFSFKIFACFLLFEFVFTAASAPFLIYYGPFKNLRKTLVGAAMSTLSHQYIATAFLSDKKIQEILQEDVVEVLEQGNSIKDLEFTNKHDKNIERYDIDGGKFKGYMLVIHDASRVKVGYSSKIPKSGELTSKIAKDNKAIAAINGGGFTDKNDDGNWTGTGGQPVGILMSNGEFIHNDIKDLDKKGDVMAITSKGVLLVGKYSLNEMKELDVKEAITFGPALVVNGQPTIKSGDGGWGIAPRTAIGQRKDGAILFLVVDGRQVRSIGATLKDVQDIMLEYGAYNATNLDGGSSTTMYYDGEVINNPCDPLGERSIPSVVYVEQ